MVWMFDQKSWPSGHVGGRAREDVPVHREESTSTGAMTKGGSASMAKVVLFERLVEQPVRAAAAECMAMGKATAKAMICEKMISSRSIGNDWAMMVDVDWCVV